MGFWSRFAEAVAAAALITAAVLSGGGIGAIASWSLATKALFAAGTLLATHAFKPTPRLEAQQQSFLVQGVETTNPVPIVFGVARLAPRIVFMDTRDDHQTLDMIGAFCLGNRVPQAGEPPDPYGGEIEAFGSIFMDDLRVVDENGNLLDVFFDDPNSGDDNIADFLWTREGGRGPELRSHKGGHEQEEDPYMEVVSRAGGGWDDPRSRWTVDHDLRGVAYIGFELKYGDNVFPGGAVPNFSCVLKGRRVLDPRDGTWKWTDNPALCLYDFLLDVFGAGLPWQLVNVQSVIAIANYCDEVILQVDLNDLQIEGFSIPEIGIFGLPLSDAFPELEAPEVDPEDLRISIKRYTLNGVVDTTLDPKANIERMLSAFGGSLVWQQGQYHFKVRHIDERFAPVHHLHEGNVEGPWSIEGLDPKDRVNTVITQFVAATPFEGPNSDRIWDTVEQAQWPPQTDIGDGPVYLPQPDPATIENPYLLADNGRRLDRTFDLPYTTLWTAAHSRAREEIEDIRSTPVTQVLAQEPAIRATVYDRVEYSHSVPLWDRKRFRVLAWGGQPDRKVRLLLKGEFEPLVPEPVLEPILGGIPFEIIVVPSVEGVRPERVWISTPFGRVNGQAIRVFDLPILENVGVAHPPDWGEFGTGETFEDLNVSEWGMTFVESTSEVWMGNNQGTPRIHAFDATTMEYTRTIEPAGISAIYDLKYHAPTDTVIVAADGAASGAGVWKLDAATGATIVSAKKPTAIDSLFGVPFTGAISLEYLSDRDQYAVLNIRDYVWYLDPVSMADVTPGGKLDGPIGGLVDFGGDHIHQSTFDPTTGILYLANQYDAAVWAWVPGLAQGGPGTNIVPAPAPADGSVFVFYARTGSGASVFGASRVTGASWLFPSVPPTGSVELWRAAVRDGAGPTAGIRDLDELVRAVSEGEHVPARSVYAPENDMLVVLPYWLFVIEVGVPNELLVVPLGDVPAGQPAGPTPPPVGGGPGTGDPGPDPGPSDPDVSPDPSQPDGPAPVLSMTTLCDDDVTGNDPYDGEISTGWKADLDGLQGEGSDNPHEIVGFAPGANPDTATPEEVFRISSPRVGMELRKILFSGRGPWFGTRPSCSGFAGGDEITRDYYLRRHIAGFQPGPVSNKVTLTIKDPIPAGGDSAPGGTPGTATVGVVEERCRVEDVTHSFRATVHLWGAVRASPGDNTNAVPLEVVAVAEGGDPDVGPYLRKWRGNPTLDTFGTRKGTYGFKAEHDPILLETVQASRSQDVPECGKPSDKPDAVVDYYAREVRSSGPGPWSSLARIRIPYPGPRQGRDDRGVGKYPPTISLIEIKCVTSTNDGTPTAWKGQIVTYAVIRATKDPDPENPHSGGWAVYIMHPGDHPDSDPTASELGSFGRQTFGGLASGSDQLDVRVNQQGYANPQPAKPVCQGGSPSISYDLYVRHETGSFGDSAWSNKISITFNPPTNPV